MIKICFIPEKFRIAEHIQKYPPRIKNFNQKYVIYIISQILTLYAYSRKIRDKSKDGFVPLNAESLRKAGIQGYNFYIKYLEDTDVIKPNNHYVPGKVSRGYKIMDKYVGEIVPVEIEWKPIRDKKKHSKNKKNEYLSKWFNENLQIDFEGAMKWINEEYGIVDQYDYKKFLAKTTNIINVYIIYKGQFMHKPDHKTFRYHTSLTNLNKKLRRFITYDHQKLVSVDLKNSQPFFLSCLLLKDLHNNKQDKGGGRSPTPSAHTLILLENILKTNREEINKYLSLVESGKLYEYMIEPFSTQLGKEYTRDDSKDMILRIFYSKEEHYVKQREVFEVEFPAISEIIQLLKAEDYKDLSILLQKFESDAILNAVCKRIVKEHSKMPFFTIHDCIVVQEGNEEIVKKKMEEELYKYVGIKPTLKLELWNKMVGAIK